MKRKIISVFLAMCMILTGFTVPIYAEETAEGITPDAEVILGQNVKTSNVTNVCMGTNRKVTLNEKNDRTGWLLKSASTLNASINIDLSDNLVKGNGDGSSYIVEVDYLDLNNGVFTVMYDSHYSSTKESPLTYVGNTGEWMTARYELDDAYFGNRLDGAYDLRITVRANKIRTSRGDLTIGAVRVYKEQAKYPVQVASITTDEVGNVFGNGEEKTFKIGLTNWSGSDKAVDITYTVIDSVNSVVWSETESMTVPAEGINEIPVTVSAEKYGLYDMQVTVSGDGFSHTMKRGFSYINNRTDGRLNKKFGYAVHFRNVSIGYPVEDVCDLIAKSGAGIVRGGFGDWDRLDPINKAKFKYSTYDDLDRIIAAIKAHGFDVSLTIGLYGPKKYDKLTSAISIPITEEALLSYEGYARYIAQRFKQEEINVASFELWNEPDIPSFNNNATMYQVGEMARRGAKAILEVDPDAVIGLSNCQPPSYDDDYEKALEAGYGEYATDLVVHTYDPDKITEETSVEQAINDYKRIFNEKSGNEIGEVHVTEYGRSTAAMVSKNYREVARYAIRDNVYFFGRGLMNSLCWYNFSRTGAIENWKEDGYGHVMSWKENVDEVPLGATEVFVAETNYNTLMIDTDEAIRLLDGEDDRYAYLFERTNGDVPIMAAWAKDKTKMFSFKSAAEFVTVYDMYGNAERVYGKDGVFSLLLTGEMQYIEGDISDAVVSTDPITFADYATEAASGSVITLQPISVSQNLNVEVDAGYGVTYVAGAGEMSEKTRVKVSLPETADVITEVTLRVKDGERTAFIYRFPVKVTEAITAKLSAAPKSVTDTSHWTLHAEVTNRRSGKPITGELSITYPENWAKSIRSTKFDTIPELATGVIEFDSGALTSLDSKLIAYKVKTDLGDEYEFSQLIDFAVAAFVDRAPTIDAVFDKGEWYPATAMITDKAEQYYRLTDDWNGPEDLSARIMMQCDAENLYLAADVTDNEMSTPETGATIWKNDSIQFGIAFEIKDIEQFYGGDFTQVALSDSPEGPVVYRHISEGNKKPVGIVEGAKLAVKREGNHTYYEMSIPWVEITEEKISSDTLDKIGFSMLVNDNDGGGRKGVIQYGGGIVGVKDIGQFKFLNVIKEK